MTDIKALAKATNDVKEVNHSIGESLAELLRAHNASVAAKKKPKVYGNDDADILSIKDSLLEYETHLAQINSILTKSTLPADDLAPYKRHYTDYKAQLAKLRTDLDRVQGRAPAVDLPYSVHISVVRGRDLIKADVVGSSDPYCILTIGDRTVQTDVIKNNLAPEWNENFEISLATKPTAIALKCMDRDAVGRDDFLGEATIPLVFDEHKEFADWITLTKVKSGAIYLRISCFGPAATTTATAATATTGATTATPSPAVAST